ncbi:hypothetical protein HJFPF1_11926 [Paramyrothecium foliicola]|nr:hypothetical protein HJFPF1_11926 [Paramyrothecium foliicola]
MGAFMASTLKKWLIWYDLIQIIRGGTGLSVLIKMIFSISTSTAYVQWSWMKLKRTHNSLGEADAMYGLLRDPFYLFPFTIWPRNLPLVFLAVTTWLLPLSSIVTPAAIAVQPTVNTYTRPLNIQETNWRSNVFDAGLLTDSTPERPSLGPSAYLNLVSSLTLSTSRPIPVPRSEDMNANISYTTNFYGPALSCNIANSDMASFIDRAFTAWEKSSILKYPLAVFCPDTGFGPAMNSSFFDFINIAPGGLAPYYVDLFSNDASRLIVRHNAKATKTTIFSCDFYNSSYTVHYDLRSDGEQVLDVERELLEPLVARNYLHTLSSLELPEPKEAGAYLGLMVNLGAYLVGTKYHIRNATEPLMNSITLSSVALTFNELLKFLDRAADQRRPPVEAIGTYFEAIMQNLTVSARYGWHPSNFGVRSTTNFPLNNLSRPATFQAWQNQYVYSNFDLALAYGISATLTMFCLAFGITAIVKTGDTHSEKFSTTFRFAKSIPVGPYPAEDPGRGADPLPSGVKRIQLRGKDDHTWTELTGGASQSMIIEQIYSPLEERERTMSEHDRALGYRAL